MSAFEAVDDFFDGDDGAPRGEHSFFLNADDALDEDVALAVGFLRVFEGEGWQYIYGAIVIGFVVVLIYGAVVVTMMLRSGRRR